MKRKTQEECFWFGFIYIIIGFLILSRIPEEIFDIFLFLFGLSIIFYCDDSGIRTTIVRKLPKWFPYYAYIDTKRKLGDRITQYYKTATYLCLLLYLVARPLQFIWVGLSIIIPMLSISRYIRLNEKISFSSSKGKVFSPTAATVFMPGFLYATTAVDNQKWSGTFWVLFIGILMTIFLPFLIKTAEYKKKKSVFFEFLVAITLFVVGAVCVVNKVYDFHETEEYRVQIQEKNEYHGRTTDYVLTVSGWNQKEDVAISISQEEYDSVSIGDWATIVQSAGALKMEWYYLKIDD